MSKIFIIAENIKNKVNFIKNLRLITKQSISEIRENLIHNKPFFEGLTTGNNSEEIIQAIQEILRFTHQSGDKIKLFEVSNESQELTLPPDPKDEITPELFKNMIQSRKEIRLFYEEMDEKYGFYFS